MNYIGILPEPGAVLSSTIIPLFGLLANGKIKEQNEDCHICYETITKKNAICH